MKKTLLLAFSALLLLLCAAVPVWRRAEEAPGLSTASLSGEAGREKSPEEENRILLVSGGPDGPGLSLGGESFRLYSRAEAAPEEKEQKWEQHLLELGQELADYAAGFEGGKYLYGGRDPEKGFDCSGLVCYVYSQFGYKLKRVAAEQAKQGLHVEPEELRPGDVLCFYTSGSYIGHVGIYLGEGYYIHAMGSAYGIVRTSLDDPYLPRRFEARRMLGCPELMAERETEAADEN